MTFMKVHPERESQYATRLYLGILQKVTQSAHTKRSRNTRTKKRGRDQELHKSERAAVIIHRKPGNQT